MSTATPFRFKQAFPFCVEDISAALPSYFSYVANLTLAQVMEFAWNLEDFSITTNGEATLSGVTADGDDTFTLNPFSSSHVDKGKLQDGSMWYGDSPTTETVWASWPAQRVPRERVCNPTQAIPGCLLSLVGNSTAGPATYALEFDFWIGIDPVNSGKFRLYYYFAVIANDTGSTGVFVQWTSRSLPGPVYVPWTSGTITIAGITLAWNSYNSASATTSGTGAMTASSSSYTY